MDDIALIPRPCTPNRATTTGRDVPANRQPAASTSADYRHFAAYGARGGAANKNLPEFVALLSRRRAALVVAYWGNGFLPGRYQGVQFRSSSDPVLHVNNPPGVDAGTRSRASRRHSRPQSSGIRGRHGDAGDSATRINAYEMAYRMQTSVPDLMDISKEPESGIFADVRSRAREKRRSPTIACWLDGWPAATFATYSFTTAIGTTTAICPATKSNGSADWTDRRPRRW